MSEEIIVASMSFPMRLDVWAAAARGIEAELDKLGYDTYFRPDATGGLIVALRREDADA